MAKARSVQVEGPTYIGPSETDPAGRTSDGSLGLWLPNFDRGLAVLVFLLALFGADRRVGPPNVRPTTAAIFRRATIRGVS